MTVKQWLAAGCISLACWAAHAAEPGQTLLASELKREPFADAEAVTNLPAGATLSVLRRQGGWLEVQSAEKQQGWLRLSSVKLTGSAAAKGDSGLDELWNVARSGRSGNTGITVATGIRGLGTDELKNAKPDPEAVKKMKAYAVGRPEAEAYAAKIPLRAQQVEYLAEPGLFGSAR